MIAGITARTVASERGRIARNRCRGDGRVPSVCHRCMCPRVSQKLDDGTSSSPRSGAADRADVRTFRHCWSSNSRRWLVRSGGREPCQSCGESSSRSSSAGVRQGTVQTALVDTKLFGKPRTFSGAVADQKPWRCTFTAYAGALSPEVKRLVERAVAADTEYEILNVQLSAAD